jgi:AcrR family transcriptional regulator
MPPRPKLSREKILRAALAIVGEDGLEGLTIRRLATALGVTPMAVYRHFENKAEITLGLLEVIIGDAAPSDHQEQDWRAWILESFSRMYDALVEHPAVIPLLGTSVSFGRHALEQMDSALGVLMGAGLDAENAAHAFHSMISYTIGAVAIRSAAQRQLEDPERLIELLDATLGEDGGRAFSSVAAAAPHMGSFASRESFRDGIRRILDHLPAP